MDYNIPEKANRVLNIIILGLLLILLRVWYLSIIQHEEHVEKARKPKRRTVIEKIERATIRDRFNIPLALNKIQYNAAVCYGDIRQIPAAKWETNAEGKRIRVQTRSIYIKKLSELLAQELQLDALKIEDTIHGKASLFPHTPFILKEDLSEEEYYRLKLMEKDWVGIRTEKGSKRYYPLGKIGADVIGYMGAISSREYYTIAQELKTLQAYLTERESGEVAVLPKGFHNPLEVRERMKELQEKAYTINDLVGKAGVEGAFDADLRGYAGKKTFEVDIKGNFLRELPGGRKRISGQRLLLSISAELQEFAEQLLAGNEKVREMRHADGGVDLSTPWIKGGAIIALEPKTGEVLAMASYPRLDPNDFIPSGIPDIKAAKQAAVVKWLENEAYIGEIWNGKRALERERYDERSDVIYSEEIELTLQRYFETILAPESSVLTTMHKISTVGDALSLQDVMQKLLQVSGQTKMHALIGALYPDASYLFSKMALDSEEKKAVQHHLLQNGGEVAFLKHRIDPILGSIKFNDDKLLVIDLCRMLADSERFSLELCQSVRALSLAGFHLLNQSSSIVQSFLQTQARSWFHQWDFQKWRELHFKEYLKEKRREEKEKKQYAKPYTDYLEQIEKLMFKTFWEENCKLFLHAFILGAQVETEENGPLTPYHEQILHLRNSHPEIMAHGEKIKAAIAPLSFEQQRKFLYTLRSFEELDQPLYGRYRSLRNSKGIQLEKHLAAAFYPLSGYGYGRSQAFRQSTPQGSIFKLLVAYQALLERYQNLKEMQGSFSNLNPLTLIDNLQWHPKPRSNEQVFGSTLDGQPIKRLYKGGQLLRSSHPNIGKIDVIGAIEQSSNIYFSILTVDHMADPLNLIHAARLFGFGEKTGIELPGEITGSLPDDVLHNRTGLYALAIGQHSLVVTPLQTALMLSAIANKGHLLKPKVVQVIAGEEPLREYRDPFAQALYPFKDNLASIGIHFPLFSSTQTAGGNPYVWYSAAEIKRVLPMPDSIRNLLIEGMHRTIVGNKGSARSSIVRALARNPQWMRDYQELKTHLIGKTGTAEILYKQTIDSESKAKIQNHIWFGGIAFSPEEPQSWENPELVVVVYLRFSTAGGKEAAPLAVEIVKKWREICQRHGRSAYVLPEGS
jgi:cell division protein FtsI/penicillin-binding protein 2